MKLAGLIDLPEEVTPRQIERWAALFDNWATCDGCCQNLFWRTPFAHAKAVRWSRRRPESVRRAAFALIAYLAFRDKVSPDEWLLLYLRMTVREATDPCLYVRSGNGIPA